MRVLVVSDEPAFGVALAERVRSAGHEPVSVADAGHAMEAVLRHRPDLLIVDALDPQMVRGVLKRAREAAAATIPTIAVVPGELWWTAAHPASLDEGIWAVVAREEALSATLEVALGSAAGALAGGAPVVVGPLRYDPEGRTVLVGERSVMLTRSEGTLLTAVLRMPGRVVSTERCAHALWGSTVLDAYRRASLRTHAYTLRRKLDQLGVGTSLVTHSGVGLEWRSAAANAGALAGPEPSSRLPRIR